MEHRDLKRFITGFLVLAIVASSLSLVFSSFYGQSAPLEESESVAADTGATPKIGDQALTEAVPITSGVLTYDISQPYVPSANPSDNFTDNFVRGIAYNIVKANPEGPQAASGLNVPEDLSVSAETYVDDIALSPLLYPIDESRITLKQNYASEDLSNYLASIYKVFGDAAGQNGIGRLVQNTTSSVPDPDMISASNFVFAKGEQDLYALAVPAPMLPLHKSLLSYFELHKQIASVDYLNDPVKALAYAGKFPTLAAQEEQRLGTELDRMQQQLPKWISEANDRPTREQQIAVLLHIHQADAQFEGVTGGATGSGGIPVADIGARLIGIFNSIGVYGSWSQMITEWLKRLATQTIKEQIVGRIAHDIIDYANNDFRGKPQFVEGWEQFLGDTANQAAGAAIGQITPRLCSGFRPFVANFLTPNGNPQRQGYGRFNCTLSQVVNSIEGFYGDFTQGGWIALADVSGPNNKQNSVWGSIALSLEDVAQQSSQARDTGRQEVTLGRGFLPTKSCVKYHVVTINEEDLNAVKLNSDYVGLVRCYQGPPTVDYSRCYGEDGTIRNDCSRQLSGKMCEIKKCDPGGQQITTPGDAVAEQVNKALGSDIDLVIGSDLLTSVITHVINAIPNRLARLGAKGMRGLFTSSDQPGGSGTGTDGGGTSTSTPPDNPNDVEAQRQTVLQLASSYETRLDQASGTLAGWSTLAANTKSSLSATENACPNRAGEARERSATIDAVGTHVEADQAELEQLSAQIAAIKQRIETAVRFLELSEALDELNALSGDISALAMRATLRSGQVAQVQADAQANTEDRACSTPLSTIDDQ